MKKIVLNISDTDYEKFRFEAIHERKGVPEVIRERLFTKPFHDEVLEAYEDWMSDELNQLLKESD